MSVFHFSFVFLSLHIYHIWLVGVFCSPMWQNKLHNQCFLWRYEPVRRTGKSDDWLTFFCSHNKVDCSEIPIVLSNLLYHYFFIELWHILILWLAKMPNGGMLVFTLIATGWRHCWHARTVLRPPIKNQNMRTGKYSFTKKALRTTIKTVDRLTCWRILKWFVQCFDIVFHYFLHVHVRLP